MANIKNIEGMSFREIQDQVDQGARFVMFQYTVSIVLATFRRPTDIYFIKAGESTIGKHIGLSALTLVAGWWGIPWGPIYTIGSLYTNFSGGKDMTQEVLAHIRPAEVTNPNTGYNIPGTGDAGNTTNNGNTYNIPGTGAAGQN